ncbi:MAG: hypothetical protein C4332_08570 [Meiothermus sp.]
MLGSFVIFGGPDGFSKPAKLLPFDLKDIKTSPDNEAAQKLVKTLSFRIDLTCKSSDAGSGFSRLCGGEIWFL